MHVRICNLGLVFASIHIKHRNNSLALTPRFVNHPLREAEMIEIRTVRDAVCKVPAKSQRTIEQCSSVGLVCAVNQPQH